jgi:hypothetical protein
MPSCKPSVISTVIPRFFRRHIPRPARAAPLVPSTVSLRAFGIRQEPFAVRSRHADKSLLASRSLLRFQLSLRGQVPESHTAFQFLKTTTSETTSDDEIIAEIGTLIRI